MEKSLQIFEHKKFGKIRVVYINGVIYFAGKDVSVALCYKDTDQALRKHVDEEDKLLLKPADLTGLRTDAISKPVDFTGLHTDAISKPVDLTGLRTDATFKPVDLTGLRTDAIFTIDSPRGMIFINESGLYSLILSSKLPQAKEFKHWVTSEVLPSIRKTGTYSLPTNENAVEVTTNPPLLHKLLDDINKSSKVLEEMFAVKSGIAIAKSISVVERLYKIELPEIKELIPPAKHKIGYLTPTQIGKIIGKSAQYVNKKLVELGFQEKDSNGGYILTDKGKDYGEAMPFERNGHAGYQIKWVSDGIPTLD